jgi:hypothetical protein
VRIKAEQLPGGQLAATLARSIGELKQSNCREVNRRSGNRADRLANRRTTIRFPHGIAWQ